MKSHLCSVMLIIACSGGVNTLCAQDQQPVASMTVAETQPGSDAQPRVTMSDELPWLLKRSAILDLRLNESPSPIDYELASVLLELALSIEPDDAEFARDLAQAAWLAGDQDRMLRATRQIIRIDPADTVAQLRLISSRINDKQTLEERKTLYDRFLGDAGVSLDPKVRSRLALDAALLEREAGHTAGFIERLHQATRLDPSHKAAASLAAQYYASVRDDPVTNLDYQIRLLKADPLDANVHLTIARLLASQGAIEGCKRFLYNAIALFSLETGSVTGAIDELRVSIEWQADGSDVAMGPLDAAISDRRAEAQAQIDAYIAAQLPTDGLIKPSDLRYTVGINKMRILAAHANDESEKVRSILDDIDVTISDQIAQFMQMTSAPGANVNALFARVVGLMLELNTIRAIVGLEAELMREQLKALRTQLPNAASQLDRIEPMALFAEGQYEASLTASEPYKSIAEVGLIRAQCLERLGRTEEAIELYLTLARGHVMDPIGAFCYTRLQKLGAADRVLTDAGREMLTLSERIPGWIEQMIERPSSFQFLSIEHEQRVYYEGERPRLTIRLQNTAPVPLSVGPNAPINSRVLIEPVGVATQTNNFSGVPRAKVIQLDTRIGLNPRESMSVTVYADSVSTDWLIEQQPGTSMRQRWRLIQGFRARLTDAAAMQQQASPDQSVFGIVNSPLGLTAETSLVQRPGLQIHNADPGELLSMFEGADKVAHRRAISAISARLVNPGPDGAFEQGDLDRMIIAINELYTRSDEPTRAAMLLTLPQRHQNPAMIGFDDHVASLLLSDSLIDSSVDPITLACALMTRTDDHEAPIFETLEHVSDQNVLRIAEIVRMRLRSGLPVLGTVGAGVEAMTPVFDGLGD
jgi:tetratricopeptide (TPR) repeat protein